MKTPNIPKKYISFSRLELITQCPAKFKHRYITKTQPRIDPASPAVIGTIVHKTLENAYPELKSENYFGPLTHRKNLIQKHLKSVMQDDSYPPELFIQAQQILKTFAENEVCNAESVIAIEQRFVFDPDKSGEITILGYIDRIDKPNSQTVHILDYKTNRMLYTAEEFRQSLQASIYIMAIKEEFPEIENVEMQFHMLRHGIRQRITRTDEELDEAREYIFLINKRIQQIKDGKPALEILNKYCPWCEYRHQCNTYQDACKSDYPITLTDPNDLQAIADEYEEISARAKIMYARKEELAELLKAKLIGKDRLKAAGHYYSLSKTTVTNFTDPAKMINLLAGAFGTDPEWVINQVSSIAKGKFDGLMKELKKDMPEANYIQMQAQVQNLIELEYQPRLQTTAIRKR
ncbi:MAG: PD-(D/E)XK nuclease family protein [candidate division Zixibacteria bacterium]|nr:PD-(D/E)XK nuclease family protein [Candidatus Tariuqbacter arcticus]